MTLIERLGDVIERNARHLPHHTFVTYEGRDRTYLEHVTRVLRLGSALHLAGARKQDRVAMLSMNGPEYVEVYGLADLCGYILTTVNFRLAAPEVEWLINDAKPSVFIFEEAYTRLVDSIRARLPSVRQYICIGTAIPSWAVGYEACLESGDAAGPPFRSAKDDYVNIMYTSGTTGRPKGVLSKHKQLLAVGLTHAMEYGSASRTTGLITLPMFHLGARTLYLAQIIHGGGIVVHRSFDPRATLETIQARRITHWGAVPTMLGAVMDLPEFEQFDRSSLRSVICLGSVMPVPLLRRANSAFGQIFANSYGQTEGGNTMLRRQDLRLEGTEEERARVGSVGYPLLHSRLRIVDDDGAELPPGKVGEICFQSDQVMEGYWNNHAATLEVLRDGWLFTGDLGYVDAEGFLFLLDRKRDMIVSGGENIYSAEVESVLRNHPGVADVAVIGVPDPKWGEAVRAIIIPKPGEPLTASEVIAFARTMIASYKCPKSVIFAEELPRVPTGKVDKVRLRKQYAEADA